jgi:ribA/ribD-fused uncharacterized protein
VDLPSVAPAVKAAPCTETAQISLVGSEISMEVTCKLSIPHRAEHHAEVKLATGEVAYLSWKGRDPLELTVERNAITSFDGDYKFLSNFFPAEVEFEGLVFPTVEHAYQAAKTVDMMERGAIRQAQKAGQAKRMGDHVTKRPNWEAIKERVMEQLLAKKFAYPALADALLETLPSQLVEGNKYHDRFWGAELVDGRWIGLNRLGDKLMKLRNDLRG